MILLFGSNNRHKTKEIQSIIEKSIAGKFVVKSLDDVLQNYHEVIENGETLEENAYKKAYEYYKLSKIPCFADDTGLEIDALNGKPGVHSARFAGNHGNDAENRKKVLSMLMNTEDKQRAARFRTVICFFDGNCPIYLTGICNGKIIREERGKNGFGYDSIFVPDGFNITFAEMEPDKKNEISHRAIAINNLIDFLKKYNV